MRWKRIETYTEISVKGLMNEGAGRSVIDHNIDKDASPTILFLGLNLRTNDNPALHRALSRGQPVIAVFVLDDDGGCTLGSAVRW